ncbi:MAG TPA: PaaI family thioesterase [Actinomycetota bacterium]|nr:PaaI family thioesterase [Actinomycetota bacterium]
MIWEEPPRGEFPDPAKFMALSGLEQMRSFLTGHGPRPPISYLTGMRPTDAGFGTSVFTMPATDWLLPPQGLLYAGPLAILADGPLGCAIQTTLPPATPYTTADLSLSMVRPARSIGTLIARGRTIHVGNSLGLSEVFVEDDRGRLIAHGTSRCYIFPSFEAPNAAPLDEWTEPEFDTPHPYERPVDGEVLAPEIWEEMDGLQLLKAQIAGDLAPPPIAMLTGMRPVEASEGKAVFVLPASLWLCSPLGYLEGGAIALLADTALGCAVQTTVPAGNGYAALDLRVNFTRPVPPDGRELTAVATVVHRGRNIALATAELVNADGKRVAFASASVAIVDRPVTRDRPLVPEVLSAD